MDGGEEKSFSAPVSGNGMGNLSRLVGGRRRRGKKLPCGCGKGACCCGGARDSYTQDKEEARREAFAKANPEQARVEEQHKQMLDYARSFPVGSKEREGIMKEADIGRSIHYATGRQEAYDKAHPGVGFLNKLGKAVPGFARGLAEFGEMTHTIPAPAAFALGFASELAKTDSGEQGLANRVRRQMEARYQGSGHHTFNRMVGGVIPTLSPIKAKQIMMMDYRGGKHPYLTKAGKERQHCKGSGIMDFVKKVSNEITNPESKFRESYLPAGATVAQFAAPVLDRYAPGVGTSVAKYSAQAAKANEAARAAQFLAKGQLGKAAESGAKGLAFHLAGKYRDAPKMAPGEIRGQLHDFSGPLPQSKAGVPKFKKPMDVKVPQFKKFVNKPLALMDWDTHSANIQQNVNRPLASKGVKVPRSPYPDLEKYFESPYSGLGRGGDAPVLPYLNAMEGGAKLTAKEKEALEVARAAKEMGHTLEQHLKAQKVPAAKRRTIMNRVNNAIAKGEKGQAVSQTRGKRTLKEGNRQSIVAKVMKERGLSLIEASKAVKAEGLY